MRVFCSSWCEAREVPEVASVAGVALHAASFQQVRLRAVPDARQRSAADGGSRLVLKALQVREDMHSLLDPVCIQNALKTNNLLAEQIAYNL